MSAALAFYAAFSLAPLLVVAIAVGSLFFGIDAVQGQLYSELESLLGRDAALAAQAVLVNAWQADQARSSGWLSLIAIGIGASATFSELGSALNTIWHTTPKHHAVAALIRIRLLSFGLVLGTGFLLVVLLIVDAAVVFVTETLFGDNPIHLVIGAIQQATSLAFLCLAFSVLLKVLPDLPVTWRAAGRGGFAAALLFSAGKHLFALYLTRAGTANVFGAASSLAVLMMWLFFSAAVFLLGAEFSALATQPAED